MATSSEYLQFVISRDTLYFKVDDTNRDDYLSRKMGPFRPFRDKPISSLSYYAVPADVLEESDHLAAWACGALVAATAAKRVRRRRASD